MKKILCIFICIIMLGGCSVEKIKEVKKEPLEISGFNTVIKSTLNNVQISANAEYVPYKSLNFTFTSPETVKDMQILCSNGEYTVNMNKLSFTFTSEKLPFNMICRTLETCINSVQGISPETDTELDLLVFSYNADGHICKLYTEKETRNFVKLSVDGNDLLFFENFEYRDKQSN